MRIEIDTSITNLIVSQDFKRLDEHCRSSEVAISSNPDAVRCGSYNLVVMYDTLALHALRMHWDDEHYSDTTRYHAFPMILLDIMKGDLPLPPELAGRVEETHAYLGRWLSEQR